MSRQGYHIFAEDRIGNPSVLFVDSNEEENIVDCFGFIVLRVGIAFSALTALLKFHRFLQYINSRMQSRKTDNETQNSISLTRSNL